MEWVATLRWRLTLLLAIILFCTLLVTGFGVVTFVRRAEVAAWQGRQSEATRNTARTVANLLESTQRSLNFINLVGLDDVAVDKHFLDKLLRQYPILDEVVYLNSLGDPIASTTEATLLAESQATIIQAPWFTVAQAGQKYYSELMLAADEEPYLMASIPAPNASVIVARVNMSLLWEFIAESRFGESGLTYIIDSQGKIIAHPDRDIAAKLLILERPPWFADLTFRGIGYGDYVNFQATRVVAAAAVVPEVHWVVVTELATMEAFANSRQAYLILGGGMLAFVVLMMWVSAEWLEGLILLPVERLRDGAIRIGQGDLTHRIEFVRNDEIGQVAVAFNQMAAELAELYDSLEQKIAERTAQLEEQTNELARSNAELAQFAYVASHDLQEPLRMITSYLQLLQRRYAGQFDKDAGEFIAFAVDGAVRMQQLIRDLLTYSRAGTRTQPLRTVDCQVILQQVLDNLQMAIADSGAIITYDALPTVIGDPTNLGQLLQNLLTNAMKFRSSLPPKIHIGLCHLSPSQEWLFTVADNGIGIERDYFERIFLIFQRLHTRSEYPGTGIGLAICKKIVDRHGGRIWVESVVGQGTTFYFTIPDRS